jgi:hypothetical protein
MRVVGASICPSLLFNPVVFLALAYLCLLPFPWLTVVERFLETFFLSPVIIKAEG